MSFYPHMNTPAAAGQVKAYQLLVNDCGEVVVYRLGADGQATGFATCDVGTDLVEWLADQLVQDGGCYRVEVVKDDESACSHILAEVRWSEAAAVLNGKAGVRRAKLETRYRQWRNWDETKGVQRYLARDGGGYTVTPLGANLDALHDDPPPT